PHIAGAIFNQQDLYRHAVTSDDVHIFLSVPCMVNRNVDPWPSCDSTEIAPPCLSTIFLQIASPIPVPANSSRLCSRWNITKIISKYCGSIPSPLSRTEKVHFAPPFLLAEMCIFGVPAL